MDFGIDKKLGLELKQIFPKKWMKKTQICIMCLRY